MGIELDTERPDIDTTGWAAPVAPTVRPASYDNGPTPAEVRSGPGSLFGNRRVINVKRPSDDPTACLWEQPPAQQDLSPIRGTPAWRAALVGGGK
jgi:hypothetical protein